MRALGWRGVLRLLVGCVGAAALIVGALVWVSLSSPSARAVVGSPQGRCADAATNLAALEDLRTRLAAAQSAEEVQRLAEAYYRLSTHDVADIEEAKREGATASLRERILGRIATLEAADEEGYFLEQLQELAAQARDERTTREELLDIAERLGDLELAFYLRYGRAAGGSSGMADTGDGEGALAVDEGPELSVPPPSLPPRNTENVVSRGRDVAVIGSCRPVRSPGAQPPSGPRGRVRVVNGTVLTDRGTLLRGAHGHFSGRPTAWWQRLRDVYGINTVRVGVRFTKMTTNQDIKDGMYNLKSEAEIERIIKGLDYTVQKAKEMGMYVIITNFTSCCNQYDEEVDKYVWSILAPRYKDEPHVIYEIHNEPVGYPKWAGPEWLKERYRQYPFYMARMYRYVRSLAPQTHLILWTPMYALGDRGCYIYQWVTGKEVPDCQQYEWAKPSPEASRSIDYTNASVGLHFYPGYEWSRIGRGAEKWVEKLRAEGYPIIETEFSRYCGDDQKKERHAAALPKVWEYLERNRISWVFLECYNGGDYGIGVRNSCGWSWQWTAPAE